MNRMGKPIHKPRRTKMNDLSTGMTFAELDTDAVASISSSAMLVDLS